MRNAQSQANSAYNSATGTAANLGSDASGISANLTPFLTSELTHPQGFSQQDQSAMLSAGLGGAGGATSALDGQANLAAARSGNSGGFQAALDSAARSRSQAGAQSAEGIASQNANLKQSQMQDAARGLQGMYGTEQSGMLGAMGQQSEDINADVNAGNSGWLQNLNSVIRTVRGS